MEKQALRNALVMLPPKLAPAELGPPKLAPAELGPAERLPAETTPLMPGAVDLLRITVEAWGPLRENDAAPMPLTVRKQFEELRKQYRRQSGRGYVDAENQEWFGLPEEMRMVILLLAQVSGNLPDLVGRDWRETPPPERVAIKAATRSLKRHSGRLVALASLW